MQQKMNLNQPSVFRLLPLTFLFLCVGADCFAQNKTTPAKKISTESVGEFLKRVEKISKSGDENAAQELLVEAAAEEYARYHMEKNRPQYIVDGGMGAGFGAAFPGVPKDYWKSISPKKGAIHLKLPPTSKRPNARWGTVYAQREFVHRFNLLMFNLDNNKNHRYKFNAK